MRKLKLQMQMSLDGFVSTGPNDEQKWVAWAWDEIKQYVFDLADLTDTEIIGRKLAVDYIPYWLGIFTKPEDPMYEVAKRFVARKKIIFTKTLGKSEWENTDLAKGNLVEEVKQLKEQNGKDIIVVGGSSFVSDLVKATGQWKITRMETIIGNSLETVSHLNILPGSVTSVNNRSWNLYTFFLMRSIF